MSSDTMRPRGRTILALALVLTLIVPRAAKAQEWFVGVGAEVSDYAGLPRRIERPTLGVNIAGRFFKKCPLPPRANTLVLQAEYFAQPGVRLLAESPSRSGKVEDVQLARALVSCEYEFKRAGRATPYFVEYGFGIGGVGLRTVGNVNHARQQFPALALGLGARLGDTRWSGFTTRLRLVVDFLTPPVAFDDEEPPRHSAVGGTVLLSYPIRIGRP